MSRQAKARLAGEIVVAYLSTRWHLSRSELPQVIGRLREVERPVNTGLGSGHEARLGRAVGRTLEYLPADSRCLVRSLVLLRLLARRGVRAALVIAARPGGSEQDLDAHAWVEVAGRPVLPPASSDYGRLVTL